MKKQSNLSTSPLYPHKKRDLHICLIMIMVIVFDRTYNQKQGQAETGCYEQVRKNTDCYSLLVGRPQREVKIVQFFVLRLHACICLCLSLCVRCYLHVQVFTWE